MQTRSKADPHVEVDVWPPDYVSVFGWRQQQLLRMRADPSLVRGAKEYYRTRPVEFINHWVDTYDPRNAGGEVPARLPFRLFKRQREIVMFLQACLEGESSGLIEKCRDIGATWVCCAFSVWLWLFWPGVSVGWGSRKEQLVDKLGDADSIFEKMRMIVVGLPQDIFWPAGLNRDEHLTYMRMINPENGATITGEAGNNIGRGGRKRIYFKDESAHYERPEMIEAALADNTRVQIDISSVNGLGNVFHRRRESGVDWEPGKPISKNRANVLVLDWRDHPAKSQKWYNERAAKFEDEGLAHIFAQEVDRNYSAAIQGLIIPAKWVRSAVDAHKKLSFGDEGRWCAALDVADEGIDRNALAVRKGSVLKRASEWGARDVGVTTRKAIDDVRELPYVELQYDSVGMGSSVKAEANRLIETGDMPKTVRLVPWNAGAGPLNPDERIIKHDKNTPLNKDFFHNLKAQGWWFGLRRRFENTHRAITEGIKFDADDLISLDAESLGSAMLRQIEKELSQPTHSKSTRMKLIVDKAPDGTRSPNVADAIMMCFWPVPLAARPYSDWI